MSYDSGRLDRAAAVAGGTARRQDVGVVRRGDVFNLLAMLPDDDARLARIADMLSGRDAGESRQLGKAITLTEAARRAGVSRSTIHRAINAGALRIIHPYEGGRSRVLEAELADWLSGRPSGAAG